MMKRKQSGEDPRGIYGWYKRIKARRRARSEIREWQNNGRPVPPPHAIKQQIIISYAKKYAASILVETGTYMGDMIYATMKLFDRIYSIELDGTLHANAVKRFQQYPQIELLQGDSAQLLPEILARVSEPCLFWLDGHYSGGVTARGSLDTPIMQELNAIFGHSVKDHIVLIDDARCFTGENDYPTIQQLTDFVTKRRPDLSFAVEDDVIRIHKK